MGIESGDEFLSDTEKIEESADGFFLIAKSKLVTRRPNQIDERLLGANPSEEEPGEGAMDDDAITGIDLVLRHDLNETGFLKKDFKIHIKGYMKRVKEQLEKEGKTEMSKAFQAAAPNAIKMILENFDEWRFYMGESLNPDAHLMFAKYINDTDVECYYFKYGLEEEKV